MTFQIPPKTRREGRQLADYPYFSPRASKPAAPRSSGVLGGHRDAELHAGVEGKKEGFGDGRYLGRFADIYNEYPSPLTVAFREVDHLRFQVRQYLLNFLPDRSVPDQGIERLWGKLTSTSMRIERNTSKADAVPG